MSEPTATNTLERLLTTAEMAKVLGMHPKTVQRAGKAGRIPRVPVGSRTYRYRPSDVLEALASERSGDDDQGGSTQ